MAAQPDGRMAAERVESLLDALRTGGDPTLAAAADELVTVLVGVYGEALSRVLSIVAGDGPAGPLLVERVAEDPMVGSLLLAHDLHPVDVDTRVQRALDGVRPYLGSHAGGVDYLGVDEAGVVRLRLQGSCQGCASSAATVTHVIERAVAQAAPDTNGVRVETGTHEMPGVAGHATGPALLQIGRRRPDASVEARSAKLDTLTDLAEHEERPDPPAVPPQVPTPTEREGCELCGTDVAGRHGHLTDAQRRSLVCACRPCYLLFTEAGAGGGRYRAIGERISHDPDDRLTQADWESLQVPVGTAFFFLNSALGQIVSCYPSPAGATESQLDLAEWDRLAGEHPLLRALTPDVEAVLASHTERGIETFLVPIDLCYALVGEVRRCWRGLDGGDEVRAALAEFIGDLRTRSVVLTDQTVGADA